jgi:hypothetical protein
MEAELYDMAAHPRLNSPKNVWLAVMHGAVAKDPVLQLLFEDDPLHEFVDRRLRTAAFVKLRALLLGILQDDLRGTPTPSVRRVGNLYDLHRRRVTRHMQWRKRVHTDKDCVARRRLLNRIYELAAKMDLDGSCVDRAERKLAHLYEYEPVNMSPLCQCPERDEFELRSDGSGAHFIARDGSVEVEPDPRRDFRRAR